MKTQHDHALGNAYENRYAQEVATCAICGFTVPTRQLAPMLAVSFWRFARALRGA